MSQIDFNGMTNEELRAYVLANRQDTAAFHAFVDRMHYSPPCCHHRAGGMERSSDATNSEARLSKVNKIDINLVACASDRGSAASCCPFWLVANRYIPAALVP